MRAVHVGEVREWVCFGSGQLMVYFMVMHLWLGY